VFLHTRSHFSEFCIQKLIARFQEKIFHFFYFFPIPVLPVQWVPAYWRGPNEAAKASSLAELNADVHEGIHDGNRAR
jgi:hypothetical protein